MGKVINIVEDILEETENVSETVLVQGRRASLAGVGLMSRIAELDLYEIFDELVKLGEGEDLELLFNHPIILAGVGALVKAREEGGALFQDLVTAGEKYSDEAATKKSEATVES